MKKRLLSMLLAFVLILGAIPANALSGLWAKAADSEAVSVTYDFKAFAEEIYEAAAEDETHWWHDLREAGDIYTKFVGSATTADPMPDAAKTAYTTALPAALEGKNWTIDTTASNFSNQWFCKRLWFNGDSTIPWGMALYTAYGDTPGIGGSYNQDRSGLYLKINAPKDGKYQMRVGAWFEAALNAVNEQTGQKGGGGWANIYVNDELVASNYSFRASESQYGVKDVAIVELKEGWNTLTFKSSSADNSWTNNRLLYLEKVIMTEIPPCSHEELKDCIKVIGENTHLEYQECVKCTEKFNEQIVDCTEGEQKLICSVCGGTMICLHEDVVSGMTFRSAVQAFSQVKKEDGGTYWDDLPDAVSGVSDTKKISSGMTEAGKTAFEAFTAFLRDEYGFTIDTANTPFGSTTALYLTVAEGAPWGMSFYPHGLGRNDNYDGITFIYTAQEEGWYRLDLNYLQHNANSIDDAVFEKLIGGNAADGGPLKVRVKLNGEVITETLTMKGSAEEKALDLGTYYFEKGSVNTISIHALQCANGYVSTAAPWGTARRHIIPLGISAVAMEPVSGYNKTHSFSALCEKCEKLWESEDMACADGNEDGACDVCGYRLNCAHENVTQHVAPVGRNHHIYYAICQDLDCRGRIDGEREACTGEIGGTCEICGGPVVFIPEDPRHIIMDFRVLAKEAALQSWWDDMVPAANKDTRMLGSLNPSTPMTEDQMAAYDSLLAYLDENYNWNINETVSKVKGTQYPKRLFLTTTDMVPWGLSLYSYNLGGGTKSELVFDVTVPEGGAGWYNVTVTSYREDTTGLTPSLTTTTNCNPGGGYADLKVNGAEIFNEYSFAGTPGEDVRSVGAVWLEDGVNTLTVDPVKDYNGTTNNGRRSILLSAIEIKPLDALEVHEYLSEKVDLRSTYLAYNASLDGISVESADTWVATASVNAGGVVTVNGMGIGTTDVTVSRNGEALCKLPVEVVPFEGDLDALMGGTVELDFMAFADRATEQSWWGALGEGEVKTVDTADTAALNWIDANTRWNLIDGEIAVNGGNEKYGIGIIDADVKMSADIPADGLYGVSVEYLQEEEGALIDISVNDAVLYEDLSTEGETAVIKANLGAVTLNKGTNTFAFTAEGEGKLRAVIFTPLGSRQVESGAKQYIDLCETYLPFDTDPASCTVKSANTGVVTASIDADGDLLLTGKSVGETTVSVSGEKNFTIHVKVVPAGKFENLNYTVGGSKTATMQPGAVLEGVLTANTTQKTVISEKQLRLEGYTYFYSTNTNVVTVDNATGDVTAVGEGEALVYAYGLMDGVTAGDFVTVVVTDEADLAALDINAEMNYVPVKSSIRLTVSGENASGVMADMAQYPVTWSVDDESIALICDGWLTGLSEGVVTVTATALVNNVPVSDSIQLRVLGDGELPETAVYVNFTDGRAALAPEATVESNGYELNRELTTNVDKLQYGNKNGLNLAVSSGDVLAVDVQIPTGGWYTLEIGGALFEQGAIADIFVDDSYMGIMDFYDGKSGEQYGGGGMRNTVYLAAGVHTVQLRCTKAGSYFLGMFKFHPTTDPAPVQVTVAAKEELLVGESVTAELLVQTANGMGAFALKTLTAVPDPSYNNYVIFSSSDSKVVRATGARLAAVGAGLATITATCNINGETVTAQMDVSVVEGKVAKAVLSAEKITLRPDAEPVQLTLSTYDVQGQLYENLPEGVVVTYTSEHPEIATVDDNGLVTLKGVEGSVRILASVVEGQHETIAEIWLVATYGKQEPTLYTYAEREAAQSNVLKYDWAWQEKESVIKVADYVVEHLDEFYNLYFYDVFPRSIYVTYRDATDLYTCPYCKTYLASDYSVYPWRVDPINNPWKITCPACDRDFPSNDFGAYYESGLDENGNFSYDLADDSLLVNELYPEMGEGWGVDNGKGYVGKDENGNTRVNVYIAYYVHQLWHDFSRYTKTAHYGLNTTLPALYNAYLYTGDETYGTAGAILLSRLAEVYPSYWIRNHSNKFGVSDGGGYTGKAIGSIWESDCLQHNLAKSADAFWPSMANPEVLTYLRARAAEQGKDPELITPTYLREQVDEGILLQIKQTVESADSWGNNGMHQTAMTLAAVALDRLPESQEMIDWVFRYGVRTLTSSVKKNTGGSILYNLVTLVDRDGFGNEGSYSYNSLWYQNQLVLADALSGYERVEGADLWENPKFVNMIGAMMKLTMCGTTTPAWGESGTVQAPYNGMDIDSMVTGFLETGSRELAVSIYAANGYSTEGLHGSIFTANPEGGLKTKIEQIVREDGNFDFSQSNMMSGLGLAVLREGPATLIKGSNESQFSDYWMQFGFTGGNHTNLDALNIGLDAFGLDLSPELGYPTVVQTNDPERMQWVISTASHNTVLVNDRAQARTSEGGQPRHFDDAGKVKLMDVEAPMSYEAADIYRRTLISVDNGEGVSYAVDFFRVLGGTEHVYSFHAASTIDPKVEGLSMVQQAMGTYAGPDVPFGFYQDNPHSTDAASNTGNGYSWLNDVYRDNAPESTFSIDWSIEDFHHRLATSSGIHLKLTMLSEEPMAEVALANGRTPQNTTNPSHLEYAMIRKSGESDMDTLFTSVIEPYQFNSYIESSELVEVELVEGTEGVTDKAAAIKVTLTSGREDYIVYATNTDCLYEIDGRFTFRGFAGVVSYTDGKLTYAYGNETKQVAGIVENDMPAITGTVVDFTKELTDNYYMTIAVDQTVTAEDFEGRYIYVNNDQVENGAYRIYGAEVQGNTVVLDLYTQDMIRSYADTADLNSGFIYNIAEGQTFTIPTSVCSDEGAYFTYTTDTVVKAGTKLTLTTGVAGSGATYEIEGLPTGAKFNAADGTITWTTSKTQVGRYPVTVKAEESEMSFVIYVVNYTGSSYDASVCAHSKAVTYTVDGVTETVCPACGTITRSENTEKFNVAGSNMTLGSDLKLNVLVKSADLVSGTYTAKITHNGEVTEATFAKYNSTYQYVSYTVAAAQMADVITVEVFDEAGNAVSNIYTTSVRTYAMNLLGRSTTNAETKTLLVDMLNYGAAAQENFGYNASDLANANLTDAQKALATQSVTCRDSRVKGENYYGSSLSLEEKILLNVYFKNVTTGMYAEITFTAFDGTKQTIEVPFAEFKKLSGSTYAVVVDDIVLAEAFTPVTVTVYNTDGTIHGTATDSVESYIARSAASDLNEAIMKFAASAKSYYS